MTLKKTKQSFLLLSMLIACAGISQPVCAGTRLDRTKTWLRTKKNNALKTCNRMGNWIDRNELELRLFSRGCMVAATAMSFFATNEILTMIAIRSRVCKIPFAVVGVGSCITAFNDCTKRIKELNEQIKERNEQRQQQTAEKPSNLE